MQPGQHALCPWCLGWIGLVWRGSAAAVGAINYLRWGVCTFEHGVHSCTLRLDTQSKDDVYYPKARHTHPPVRSLSTPSRSCQPSAVVRLCVVWQPGHPMALMQSYCSEQGSPVPLLCSLIVSSPSGYNTEGGKAAVP
jgi:hypothetical protein